MTWRRALLFGVFFALAVFAISPEPAAAQHGPDTLTKVAAPVGEAKEWTNSIGMKFVRIGPGKFMMGTPENEPGRYPNETLHELRITRAYLLGAYEVTRGQFRVFVHDTGFKTDAEKQGFALSSAPTSCGTRPGGGSWHNAGFEQTDDHPVVSISWNDSMAFALAQS